MTVTNRAPCRGCKKEIIWIKTASGKNMPCEVEQTTVVTVDGRIVYGHVPHWGNCPKADEFRR